MRYDKDSKNKDKVRIIINYIMLVLDKDKQNSNICKL